MLLLNKVLILALFIETLDASNFVSRFLERRRARQRQGIDQKVPKGSKPFSSHLSKIDAGTLSSIFKDDIDEASSSMRKSSEENGKHDSEAVELQPRSSFSHRSSFRMSSWRLGEDESSLFIHRDAEFGIPMDCSRLVDLRLGGRVDWGQIPEADVSQEIFEKIEDVTMMGTYEDRKDEDEIPKTLKILLYISSIDSDRPEDSVFPITAQTVYLSVAFLRIYQDFAPTALKLFLSSYLQEMADETRLMEAVEAAKKNVMDKSFLNNADFVKAADSLLFGLCRGNKIAFTKLVWFYINYFINDGDDDEFLINYQTALNTVIKVAKRSDRTSLTISEAVFFDFSDQSGFIKTFENEMNLIKG